MPEIKYEVVDKIGVVSEGTNGWNKEPMELPCEGRKNIVHYALYKKPWQYDDVIYGEYFWHYAKTSPFYETICRNRDGFSEEEKVKKEAMTKIATSTENAEKYRASMFFLLKEIYYYGFLPSKKSERKKIASFPTKYKLAPIISFLDALIIALASLCTLLQSS
mgnify:CR=1 FL=1